MGEFEAKAQTGLTLDLVALELHARKRRCSLERPAGWRLGRGLRATDGFRNARTNCALEPRIR